MKLPGLDKLRHLLIGLGVGLLAYVPVDAYTELNPLLCAIAAGWVAAVAKEFFDAMRGSTTLTESALDILATAFGGFLGAVISHALIGLWRAHA